MSKYEPLRKFLESAVHTEVPMTFAEIEKILGFRLPQSQNVRAWWSNNPSNNVMTKEWLAAGYKTEQVDIAGGKLVFRRIKPRGSQAPTQTSPQGTDGADTKSKRGRHPLIGFMKGMLTIAPGVDLTEPADPDWAEIAWGEAPQDTDQN